MHGCPPGHRLHGRGERLAAAIQIDSFSVLTEAIIPPLAPFAATLSLQAPIPSLTVEQYAQLMSLLHKQASESSEKLMLNL